MKSHYLKKVFEPSSVAIVGASERPDSVGGQVLRNMLDGGFKGRLYAVNPKHDQVFGIPSYHSLRDIDHPIELVVIAIPAPSIPKVMLDCTDLEVGAVMVLSAGFAEVGPRGLALQNEIVDLARTHGIPLVGPNCLGVMRPSAGLNATFAKSPGRPGQVALVAQSGAFCTALLDWADANNYGFSAVASLGATADVGFGEVLDFLALDPKTKSILLYIEGVSNARTFLSGLRVAARLKPVIVVKSGRYESGTRAAVSHTGAMLGSDHVFDAAVRRAGAVRVNTVAQLFTAAQTLVSDTRVEGPRLAILTNGGGPGVMAADRASELQVPLADLSHDTVAALGKVLPAHWSHSDPVDILGDADAERYRRASEILLADPQVDALLVLLTPQAMTDPDACAKAVTLAAAGQDKPVLACWMGEKLVAAGRSIFGKAGIPQFRSPEAGIDAFGYLAEYRRSQKALLQAPPPMAEHREPDVYGARLIIEHAISDRRYTLNSSEAKAVLAAFRIPTSPSINAHTAADALVAAETVGLPIAMKINSPDITHKSDVGGVHLNIGESRSVRTAFRELVDAVAQSHPEARIQGVTVEPMVSRAHAREVMIGIAHDPVFGPVVSFGAGGTAVEIIADNQVALPPLNDYLARELVRGTRMSRYLRHFRNLPEAKLDALVDTLCRVSEIACELPELMELDINPLLVDESGVIAVDARVVVAPPKASSSRYSHMAIHPYPSELATHWQMPDGTDVSVRPIRPEDAKIEQAFVRDLSPESKYFRFMQSLEQLSPLMLARFTQIDYDREMALVAVTDADSQNARIIAVVRYVSNPDRKSCEFALAVADDWQKRGIGRQLMQRLMGIARERGIEIMEGEVLANNSKMLRLCERLGFRSFHDQDDPDVVHVRRHI